jgi:hypothetical protein
MFVTGKLAITDTSPSKTKHVIISLMRAVIMAINIQHTDFTMAALTEVHT